MFKVLTNRARPRLTSPRFVVGSVIAHLWVALAVATVMRAEPAPEPDEPQITEWDITQPPPPRPDPTPPATAERPMREGATKELQAPTRVPDKLPPADPMEPRIDPRAFSGEGPVGDTVVSHPRPSQPDQPPGTGPARPDFSGEPILAEMAEVRPTLANLAEAGRLLERNYPPSFADAGISGRTVVEVIVEANGRVRPGSARIVETSNEQFGDATLRIIERLRFRPARVGDQPIAVIVQVPIDWRAAH